MITLERKYTRLLLKLTLTAVGIFAIWAFFRWGLAWILPFLVAIAVARLEERPLQWMRKRLKLPRWACTAICTLILYGALFFLLFLIVSRIFFEIGGLLSNLPDWIAGLPDVAESLMGRLDALISAAPAGMRDFLRNSLNSIIAEGFTIPQSVYTTLGGWVTSAAGALPKLFLFVVTSLLSTYFISSDYPQVKAFLMRQLPETWREKVLQTKTQLTATLGKWLKAQVILLFITFAELCVGFLILGVDYFLVIAALVALVDALPVVGLGLVLLPWGLLALLQGNTALGLGLVILFAAASLTRSFAEPKLVGKQLGLHPMLTLVAMYVGFQIMGVLGMILFPIAAITLKQMQEWGYIRLWK